MAQISKWYMTTLIDLSHYCPHLKKYSMVSLWVSLISWKCIKINKNTQAWLNQPLKCGTICSKNPDQSWTLRNHWPIEFYRIANTSSLKCSYTFTRWNHLFSERWVKLLGHKIMPRLSIMVPMHWLLAT